VTSDGKLLRLTLADGSYLRTDYDQSELRLDRRVPYLDLRYDHAARQLAVTVRGSATRLGVTGVEGWSVSCNEKPLAPERISVEGPLSVFVLN